MFDGGCLTIALWLTSSPIAFSAVRSRGRFGLSIAHYSVQSNHVHLVVEQDGNGMARGLKGLCVRLARGWNRVLGRRGPVFG